MKALKRGALAAILNLLILILVMACATANNIPESERIPNEFDGRWELDSKNSVYMFFNIKYGKIEGRIGNMTWPLDVHLPITGSVSKDGEFTFEHAGHLDISNGYDLEVTSWSVESGYIEGYAYDDFNERFKWIVFRK